MDKDSSSSSNKRAAKRNRASSSQVQTPGSLSSPADGLTEDIDIVAAYEDCESFLSAIRGIFGQESRNHTQILKAFCDYGGRRITVNDLCERMKESLEGHVVLTRSVNDMLPEGHRIDVDAQRKDTDLKESLGYVVKVKDRFKDDEPRYMSFLDLLLTYNIGEISLDRLCTEVITLFVGHCDLIDEFAKFVPPTKIIGS